MIVMGLNVGKSFMRWVTVSGTLEVPELLASGSVDIDPQASQPFIMDSLDNALKVILDANPCDALAYRMHMGRGMTQAQVAIFHYPWGMVNLACGRRNIPVHEFIAASLTAKRFGLPKGNKPMLVCDQLAGTRPRWDDTYRYAVCAAWATLPKINGAL